MDARRAQAIRIAKTRLAIVDGTAGKILEKHGCTPVWLAWVLHVSVDSVNNWFVRLITPSGPHTLKIAGLLKALENGDDALAGYPPRTGGGHFPSA